MDTNQQLLDAIVSYSKECKNVIALILIGSQARQQQPADEYSDIDLILVVDDPDSFLWSDEWLAGIGNHHISFVEQTISGQPERRVLFDSALDVDFVIVSGEQAEMIVKNNEGMDVFSRGYRMLINKTGLCIPPLTGSQSCPAPNQDAFANTVNDFWYHAIWTVKKLLRNELWAGKFCVDSYMKQKLLWMIEQYEHAKHGADYHTWYGGRFIDKWADPDITDRLRNIFAHYDRADMAAALAETMGLYRSLALEVAEANGLEYPSHADAYATSWVKANISRITAE